MAEMVKQKTGGRWRYVLGVLSLVLAGISGAGIGAVWALIQLSELIWSPDDFDAPGVGLLVLFFAAGCLLLALTALLLAAVALVKPGRGWRAAVAGWLVGSAVLVFAVFQSTVGTPFGGPPEPPPPERARGEPGAPPKYLMMEEMMGAAPGTSPEALLSSDRREAVGLEGTFCWAPDRTADCVEDAGVPVPRNLDSVIVETGGVLDVTFFTASRGEFRKRNPKLTGAVVYPLKQASKTTAAPGGAGYLLPDGPNRRLHEEELSLRGENGEIVANAPAGDYVLQISTRSPEGAETWRTTDYHFRLRVLPAEDP